MNMNESNSYYTEGGQLLPGSDIRHYRRGHLVLPGVLPGPTPVVVTCLPGPPYGIITSRVIFLDDSRYAKQALLHLTQTSLCKWVLSIDLFQTGCVLSKHAFASSKLGSTK